MIPLLVKFVNTICRLAFCRVLTLNSESVCLLSSVLKDGLKARGVGSFLPLGTSSGPLQTLSQPGGAVMLVVGGVVVGGSVTTVVGGGVVVTTVGGGGSDGL